MNISLQILCMHKAKGSFFNHPAFYPAQTFMRHIYLFPSFPPINSIPPVSLTQSITKLPRFHSSYPSQAGIVSCRIVSYRTAPHRIVSCKRSGQNEQIKKLLTFFPKTILIVPTHTSHGSQPDTALQLSRIELSIVIGNLPYC